MKILFLTTTLLSKSRNGSEVASQCFIDTLKKLGHDVTVVGYLRKGDTLAKTLYHSIVVDSRYIETKKSKFFSIIWLAIAFLKKLPYSSAKYYSRRYIKLVTKLIRSESYDLIVIDHAQLAWIEKYIKDKRKIVAIAHNVEHQMYAVICQNSHNFLAKIIYQREARLIKVQEKHLLETASQLWTLTSDDACNFSDLKGDDTEIKVLPIPPGVEKVESQPERKYYDIALIGSWLWKANIEALNWFLQTIYPNLPIELSIHIAGKGADWLTHKYPNIYYRGIVPDAQEFMAQAKVVAIPTLTGGGIQIKTLDAIASGSLIVATPIALRGIDQPPTTVRVSNNSAEFAKLLVSAVESQNTQNNFQSAKDWYRARQVTFDRDIASAINAIA